MNYLGSAVAGNYELTMGDVKIKNSVPINGSVTDGRVYRRTLGNLGSDFDIQVTDCTLNNALVEFKGSENQAEWSLTNPLPAFNLAGTEIVDKDMTSYKVLDFDNYPRCVINHAYGMVKVWSFYIRLEGTSGDTYAFEPAYCYAYDAGTLTVVKDLYPSMFAQRPVMAENTTYSVYVPVGVNCTQLRFSINSIEHPFPAFPAPIPEYRIYEMIIKNA